MMRNLLITIRFDGSRYHGFQVQENALTICEVFQDAVEAILGERYDIKGCSRTDAGVHADMYCLSMKTANNIPENGLVRALNTALPADVAVINVCTVPSDFHARYDCVGKTYRYIIYNAPWRDPFRPLRTYHSPHILDEEMLNTQAADFCGTYDFSAFCAAGSSVSDTVRTITDATVMRTGNDIIFEISGNGFLYNMVRIMAGTLLDIAAGKIEKGSIPSIILSGNRTKAGRTAPARGLYLYHVKYQSEIGVNA